jgi:hypothetical protein
MGRAEVLRRGGEVAYQQTSMARLEYTCGIPRAMRQVRMYITRKVMQKPTSNIRMHQVGAFFLKIREESRSMRENMADRISWVSGQQVFQFDG